MVLLALGAGAVNAGAFAACERFVTHVTGTATRIGIDTGSWLLMAEYTGVLLAFIVGAMASVLALQGRALRGKRPLHAVPLLVTAALLVAVAVLGSTGFFGPIGGQVEEPSDFALLLVLALAMGLMNAGVASSTAIAVRTTHMTGPATDFGVSLAVAWLSDGAKRREALQLAALRGGKLAAFIAGAALMFPFVERVGHAAFIAPAAVVLIAAVRSFLPSASVNVVAVPRTA
jgi:uncharacterized membrane protein YoaK (UPF0700 family)